MGRFFTRERFGRPQVLASCLLLAFLAQCLWLVEKGVRHESVNPAEIYRLDRGTALWNSLGSGPSADTRRSLEQGEEESANEMDPALRLVFGDGGYDAHHSPLWYLIAAAPLWLRPVALQPENIRALHWSAAVPYLGFGLLLGASLWYVARRLFGNAGGYIALALYCFSPGIVRSCALWFAEPEVGAAWGAFGAIFTAIAVAHTLYAPREVVLWNWRRIMLLGLALTLAVGSQFGLVVVIPVLLASMLYLAPDRNRAGMVILVSACLIAMLLLFASYVFHPTLFLQGLKHARFLDINLHSAGMLGAYKQVVKEVAGSGPVLLLLFPAALIIFLAWPRARYFGNAAPLMMAVLFLVQRVLSPHAAGSVFSLTAVVFIFVFISGIVADLLETKSLESVSAVLVGLVAANALWDLVGLARIGH